MPPDGQTKSPLLPKAKVGKLQQAGKITPADANALLAGTQASLLAMKPGYERVIAWAQSELPTAPSGRVGAISLPGGADWYAAARRAANDATPTSSGPNVANWRRVWESSAGPAARRDRPKAWR